MSLKYLIINIIMKLILSLFYRKEFKHILYELKLDIIYLFYNSASFYTSNNYKGKVIGSEHTGLTNSKTISNKIFIKLIKNNLFWRRIDGFHLFPREHVYKTILNKKHSFILSNGANCTYILNSNYSLNNENVKNKKCIFLFIARLESCKEVKLVFDAWKNMKNREFTELHIVGGGSLQEYFSNIHVENFFMME
ncbi:MAG: hypothetical protein QXL51_06675 [Candidatus Aenigmatarchaeota archaeon]